MVAAVDAEADAAGGLVLAVDRSGLGLEIGRWGRGWWLEGG